MLNNDNTWTKGPRCHETVLIEYLAKPDQRSPIINKIMNYSNVFHS